ncbi:MotA/TolQ/ExbB proton channel family protein [Hirschia baltica]|uniref:MotA/TolQ/ExbB proton channel n=1 Tax=Hirschia baltica (strain ATCC 49814 / DSM 5838 / IFAM 1418) TaxID=582402 RepID=C6XJ73_HIRBI|nr:MotA/TolQ/ExbB proton channel family protein [Hirschia baltica]ACT59168.1 MotA/TolQ/ExbB proton channel [Hirschia baltica ATCC 49814]
MTSGSSYFSSFGKIYEMGGPVLVILALTSVLTFTLILYKLWQFYTNEIGRHKLLKQALFQWDNGLKDPAKSALEPSKHCLMPMIQLGMSLHGRENINKRLESEAEQAFQPFERGFRTLDMVAQLAPLLGLFGTVLGMIEAFRALQGAGSQVDPAILAGGIWVALMTTAAGLAVAMPTSIALSWFEAQMDNERRFAEHAISTLDTPQAAEPQINTAEVSQYGA